MFMDFARSSFCCSASSFAPHAICAARLPCAAQDSEAEAAAIMTIQRRVTIPKRSFAKRIGKRYISRFEFFSWNFDLGGNRVLRKSSEAPIPR